MWSGVCQVTRPNAPSDLKGTLLLRPVFHRKDERSRAHVLICLLALVIVRVAETRTGAAWRTIRAELGQIRQGHFYLSGRADP